jgi:chromosome segregation ATPase
LEKALATSDDEAQAEREIAHLEAALARNAEVGRNNLQFLTEGTFDRTEFAMERARLADQRAALQAELSTLQNRAATKAARTQQLKSAKTLLQALRDTVVDRDPDFATKRSILEKLVESITVKPSADGEWPEEVTVSWVFEEHGARYQRWGRERQASRSLTLAPSIYRMGSPRKACWNTRSRP